MSYEDREEWNKGNIAGQAFQLEKTVKIVDQLALDICEYCRKFERAERKNGGFWHGDPSDFRTNPVPCPASAIWKVLQTIQLNGGQS